MNGSLFDSVPPSIWRADPSQEVDAAWEAEADTAPFLITREDVIKLDKDPNAAVPWPEDENLYIAQGNLPHMMHCLNEPRRQMSESYYWPGGPTHPLHHTHMRHCLNIIREELLCSASLDVITYQWMELQDVPFPDFSMNRQCRNWGDVLEWQKANRVDLDVLKTMTRLPGAVQAPAPPELIAYALSGWRPPPEDEDADHHHHHQ